MAEIFKNIPEIKYEGKNTKNSDKKILFTYFSHKIILSTLTLKI